MYINPTLLQICGPIGIRIYGLMIVTGLCLFMYLVLRDERRKQYIPEYVFHTAFFYGVISGIIGGRLLFFLTEYQWDEGPFQFFKLWEPGFSLLGAVIAIPPVVTIYLWFKNISSLLFFDIIAVYIPLLQAISRFGCFGSGCCHGLALDQSAWWTVMYEHPDSLAPLNIPLHPTQLYSAVASLILFFLLLLFSRLYSSKRGFIFGFYLFGEGIARFVVDFFRMRSEYEMTYGLKIFQSHVTYYQGISAIVSTVGVIMMIISFVYSEKRASKL
ncbi:hypothetical protein COB28_03030 [Candidatus Dependentiae bacterium]|nr:MAG: hypothetical protein COB28_03030 [Candidatus Dependentiae bacterium]